MLLNVVGDLMKEINVIVEGGKATMGPPLGPALGGLGVNPGQIVSEINKATASFAGMKVPVKVLVDPKTKEFSIEVGSPPVAELLKKEAGVEKGHGKAWREGAVGDITMEKIVSIAKSISQKSLSLSLKEVVKEVVGTALSLGITVDGKNPKDVIKDIDDGKYESIIH